jgi:hypothetical protein
MKKANMSNVTKLSFVGTAYLWHANGIGSQSRHIAFKKHEKIIDKERGIEDGTTFNIPRSFNFFIKGAREVNINFMKITNLAVYRTLKKAD